MSNGSQYTREHSRKCRHSVQSSREHAQQKCSEGGSYKNSGNQRPIIEDTRKAACGIGRHDRDHNPHHCYNPAHHEVMTITTIGSEVSLIKIVCPDGIEGGDVTCHS